MNNDFHDHSDIYRDINGFGKRVTEVEREQGACMVQIKRNADDIQDLFKLSERNATAVSSLGNIVSGLVGKVTGAVAIVVVLVQLGFMIANILSK